MSFLIVNDLLTYLYCQLNSTPVNTVHKIIEDFYSPEKIARAHLILEECFPEKMPNSPDAHIEDIINFIKSTPDEILPTFICSNNFNIPSLKLNSDLCDVQSIYEENYEMKSDISKLSASVGNIVTTISMLSSCNDVESKKLHPIKCNSQTGVSCNNKKNSKKRSSRNSEKIYSSPEGDMHLEDEDRRRIRYICPKCKYSSELKSALKIHLTGHYAGFKSKCLNCFDLFTNSKDLANHNANCSRFKHESRPNSRYRCDHCSSHFWSKKTLINHEAYHDISRPFACAECGYRFYTQRSLDAHVEVHTSVVFKCPHCEYGNTKKACVALHMRLHTGPLQPHKCSKCTFSARHKSLLEKHLLIHGEERRFRCEKCNAAFKTKYTLDAHRRSHCTDRPFKCRICNRAFKISTQMKIHFRTHSNNRPYACTECDYKGKVPALLRKHSRKHMKKDKGLKKTDGDG